MMRGGLEETEETGDHNMNAVRFERDGDLGAIVLGSPPNWLTRRFSDDLAEAVRQAAESGVRALLIRAEGGDFSVGGAVQEWPDKDQRWFRTFVGEVSTSYRTIEGLPVPVVAAVRGNARGGGLELVLSADLVIASQTAVFTCIEATSGMVPLAGAVQRIAAAAGPYHAAWIAMLMPPVTAAEGAALNLVAEVVPDEELDQTGADLAGRLASGPTRGYAAIKSLVKAHGGGVVVADRLLADLTMGLYETADARNAIPELAGRRRHRRTVLRPRGPGRDAAPRADRTPQQGSRCGRRALSRRGVHRRVPRLRPSRLRHIRTLQRRGDRAALARTGGPVRPYVALGRSSAPKHEAPKRTEE
jgi:enoyl-CoA hydratase/carnithine racemase